MTDTTLAAVAVTTLAAVAVTTAAMVAVRSSSMPPALGGGLVRVGTPYGGFVYNSTGIGTSTIVYSVGIGEDTSWDEAIISRHGLHVYAYDPTPKAARYVKQRNADLGRNHFHFAEVGLAARAGKLNFTKPKRPAHVSMHVSTIAGLGEPVELKVDSLQNLMFQNNHTYIGILKLDIEGSEYDLFEAWIKAGWFPMDQLLVETHPHFLNAATKGRHKKCIAGLKAAGLDIVHHTKDGNGLVYTFQQKVDPPSLRHAAANLASLTRILRGAHDV